MEEETLDAASASDGGGIFGTLGEQVGRFLAESPGGLVDFFGGVGRGAGVSGFVDWAALLIGLALILAGAKGLMGGKIVRPIIVGAIGVALMGWAVT